MTDHLDAISELENLLDEDADLGDVLTQSLLMARDGARSELKQPLYDALQWPTTIAEYKDYLRWIPRQSDAEAWAEGSPGEMQAREVSDRLAHFFWLVDQHPDHSDRAVESSPALGDWLTRFAREWESYLDTPDSFDEDILRSFVDDSPEYAVQDSMIDGRSNMPSGWLTFNQFFARELNRGLRPIAEPNRNSTVVSPADCSFQHVYEIGSDSAIPATRIKGTHTYGTVTQLMQGSEFADRYTGGTFAHYMLPPSAYHRFHVPVSGTVLEAFTITGQVYLDMGLDDGTFASNDAASTGFEFSQTRGIVTLDTASSPDGDIGIITVVAVGMAHVASVRLTAAPGGFVAKGDEFGYWRVVATPHRDKHSGLARESRDDGRIEARVVHADVDPGLEVLAHRSRRAAPRTKVRLRKSPRRRVRPRRPAPRVVPATADPRGCNRRKLCRPEDIGSVPTCRRMTWSSG